MANNLSSSSSLRFLRLPEKPGSEPTNPVQNPDLFELHENDVVWSFSISEADDTHLRPSSTAKQPENHRRRFNPAESGLSAALSDDHHRLVRRKAKAVPAAIRHRDGPPAAFHQSAPVKIPIWPEKSRREYEIDDSFGEFDDGDEEEEEEEMVPPHVIVARSHVTFSVFEGVGRTLKGRDLRRVRNTVFQKTGFID